MKPIDDDPPEESPKLEKKASMSQIISSLKSRFGSNSGRKKGKKSLKPNPGKVLHSGRLLWNPNGQWKDKWFVYEDGVLSGYKDQGIKPPDVIINVKTSKLTQYCSDQIMRRLNLFKITTMSDIVHLFAAWTEEEYETWIETFNCPMNEKVEGHNLFSPGRTIDEESFDGIIPYERAVSNEEMKAKEKIKCVNESREGNTRFNSIDSGNDGDESGLDSSISSLSLFEARKRIDMERKLLGRLGVGRDKTDFIPRSLSDRDLSHFSQKHNVNKNSIMSASNFDLSNARDCIFMEDSPNPRSSSISSHLLSKRDAIENDILRKDGDGKREDLIQETSKRKAKTTRPDLSLLRTNSLASQLQDNNVPSQMYFTASDNPTHMRQFSGDSYLHLNEGTIDNCPTNIDVVGGHGRNTFFVAGSEDECSESNSIISTNNFPSGRNRKQDKLEDELREETLLRKRRNSLSLEREDLKIRINELRDSAKRNSKEIEQLENLEIRLSELEGDIKKIDLSFNVNVDPHVVTQKKRKPSVPRRPGVMTKILNVRQKDISLMGHSLSIESLASTASPDSSVGRESPYHFHSFGRESPRTAQLLEQEKLPYNSQFRKQRISMCELNNMILPDNNRKLNGFQELLLTTQKLENGILTSGKKDLCVEQPSLSSRSRSMSSVDKIQPKLSGNSIGSPSNADLIIEDFEKFSAMLSSQMQTGRIMEV